ncbi:MAG TPA: class I SAM-dependent methyltransferase [Roseiflexaceae bacterium]|nr:class I SAM-dependent methyltransferase [Roseiflexaceae bacterium]
MSDYEGIARYYDLDHDSFGDDIPFFRELARRADGPVLEAMCGTGRVLIPLARDGHRVTGIDSSAAMLAIARERVATADVADLVDLIEADLRTFSSRRRFSMAFVALNSFMHLTSTTDQLAGLQALHRVLRPGATLVIDLTVPDLRSAAERDGVLVLDRTFSLAEGVVVQKYVVQRLDPAAQISRVTFIYDEISRSGGIQRSTTEFQLRWIYRFELEHLLVRAGFHLQAAYGSYELDPYSSAGEHMLVLATRV